MLEPLVRLGARALELLADGGQLLRGRREVGLGLRELRREALARRLRGVEALAQLPQLGGDPLLRVLGFAHRRAQLAALGDDRRVAVGQLVVVGAQPRVALAKLGERGVRRVGGGAGVLRLGAGRFHFGAGRFDLGRIGRLLGRLGPLGHRLRGVGHGLGGLRDGFGRGRPVAQRPQLGDLGAQLGELLAQAGLRCRAA